MTTTENASHLTKTAPEASRDGPVPDNLKADRQPADAPQSLLHKHDSLAPKVHTEGAAAAKERRSLLVPSQEQQQPQEVSWSELAAGVFRQMLT
ncbi:hypothetical protein S7711_10784 [Stachybotrys chartarum IBT 7711]|uniref:Uncharacterized protein n=1 Tax=Stachybotrys chartarum (strain CBS 109288 / IBT 7711) TaxID=1280523 RepID=A0A084AHU8_STACB|nr:hypothetical protein S7711_10784 [Stachybotrys chartarum IBT 7711]KFA53529.1 hypothetical protein S40293_11079 [Stachybotrys chartarum IBT 40293]KFA76581.1 hypothetical protein S40288_10622 [Stachybotrys chartarum IBT 40288]